MIIIRDSHLWGYNKMAKTVITQTPPNLIGTPRIDFNPEDFDIFLQQHGYDIEYQRSVRCPCKSKGSDNTIKCRNCGGTGYVFINPIKTRAAVVSINATTKFKEWSEEKLGTVSITLRSIDYIGFMDKIIILDSQGIQAEVLYPIVYNDQLFSFTIYNINSIVDIFMYNGDDKPLKKLIEGVDFSFTEGENKILFNAAYKATDNFTISVAYRHYLAFNVIDLPHNIRNNYVIQQAGEDKNIIFPTQAIAKRSHYILDAPDYNERLFDNSYIL